MTNHISPDGKITIHLSGTQQPYCEIEPGYSQAFGPHIKIYRIGEDGLREYVLTLSWGGMNSLIRWLPLTMAAARRLEVRALREGQQIDKPAETALD